KLLNEILNFSKIESGRTQFRNEPFDLHQLQAEVIAAFSSSAKLKKTKLVSHSNIKPNSYFIGDTLKIRQILNNLISNAIKFCDEGTVTLSTLWETTHSEAQEGDKEGKVCFMVSDTGIGIPKDQQQAVFSEFIQLDNRLSRKYEGTGLGLAITQKLVEKMGGSITLASELGKGSTFTVTLPLQPTQAPQVESHDEINNTSHVLNILLVEDNKTNQMVISRLISKSGHHSVLADNGVDCLKKVKQCHFDLILMDIMMPEMDGIQATQELRKIYSKDTLPILALSANTETDNIEKCMEAGMNEYLHKPIRIHELKSILNRYSHRSSDTATP
ncbi:MAG: ATP-binding protein, partial [Gammaproteobacteria bacterium]